MRLRLVEPLPGERLAQQLQLLRRVGVVQGQDARVVDDAAGEVLVAGRRVDGVALRGMGIRADRRTFLQWTFANSKKWACHGI